MKREMKRNSCMKSWDSLLQIFTVIVNLFSASRFPNPVITLCGISHMFSWFIFHFKEFFSINFLLQTSSALVCLATLGNIIFMSVVNTRETIRRRKSIIRCFTAWLLILFAYNLDNYASWCCLGIAISFLLMFFIKFPAFMNKTWRWSRKRFPTLRPWKAQIVKKKRRKK